MLAFYEVHDNPALSLPHTREERDWAPLLLDEDQKSKSLEVKRGGLPGIIYFFSFTPPPPVSRVITPIIIIIIMTSPHRRTGNPASQTPSHHIEPGLEPFR